MPIDTLITDVRGQDIIILATHTYLWYAPCTYDAEANNAEFDINKMSSLIMAKPVLPLDQHERQLRRTIAVNMQFDMQLTQK
ncbi:MAG: hypothetical protein AAFN11_00170 [Chloroflexota bacterium]